MAKRLSIDVANDPLDVIKTHLTKLKREEAKLEIALTLREFPEVEEELVRLTTCVVELDIVERSMKLESVGTDAEQLKATQSRIDMQIAALKAKIATLVNDNDATKKLRDYYGKQIEKLEVDKFSAGMTKKNLKYLEHYENLLHKLREVYNKFAAQNKFPETFDVFFHVLNLKKYLEIADDLIARKG